MSWGAPSDGAKWQMRIFDSPGIAGALQVDVWGGLIVGSTDLRDGQWHHVAAILRNDGSPDAEEIELYVDGQEEVYSHVESGPVNTGTEALSRIGVSVASAGGLSDFFDGEMDDLRIYERALSANQMAQKTGWDGLVAHWPLDSDATDSSGHGHNGTEAGGMTYTASGRVGGAAVLDGMNDYIEINGYKGITRSRSRTVAAWVNTTATGVREIVSWGGSGGGARWQFELWDGMGTPGVVQLEVGNGRVTGSTNVRDGVWHHVAAVLEDSDRPNVVDVKLYVDGHLETLSASVSMPVLTGEVDNVLIGGILGRRVFQNFNGMLDDIRIYRIALSQADIAVLAAM